jgi:3-oxoacyl-[acyl-carrier-protein] synthase II
VSRERVPRVAITGIGIVSALGSDSRTTFRRLTAGEVGIRNVESFDVSGQRCRLAAEVRGLDVRDIAPTGAEDSWSRSDAMGLYAAREALAEARFDARVTPVALAVGGTTGGMREAEEILTRYSDVLPAECARRLLAYPLSTPAERIADGIGGVTRIATVCSACSSSANAIALAGSWILSGRARAVLAGGTDGLCRLTFAGFDALGVMSGEPCRPFDQRRNGMSLGEGAAFLLLEVEAEAIARGASILGFLAGFSVGAEAFHITHPEPTAKVPARLIGEALARAGLVASDIDYVNAHGTATPQNDAAEGRALGLALGSELGRIRVSSSKGQVGHTLGAAGAIEAAITVLALANGVAPPTAGLETPDPEIALRHVRGSAESGKLRAALSTSFGFGGTGVVLAFESADAAARDVGLPTIGLVVSAVHVAGPLGSDPATYLEATAVAGELSPEPVLDPARSRRYDRVSALVSASSGHLLGDANLESARVGLAHGSAYGNVERSVEFLRRLFDRGPRFASPAEFPHLVPSAAAGNASIYLGLGGPVLNVSELGASAEAALALGASFIEAGLSDAMIAGSAESRDAIVASVLGPLHSGKTLRSDRRGEGSVWLLLESERGLLARNQKALAKLRFWDEGKASVRLPAPLNDAACVIVSAGLESLLDADWAKCPRLELGDHPIPEEVRGAFAVAAAVQVIATGRAREVLVLSDGRETVRAFCFVAP